MQTCILPIKTSIRKLRCIACGQMCIALNDVLLAFSRGDARVMCIARLRKDISTSYLSFIKYTNYIQYL